MSWANENKFLTGFIGVMVVGVGFLGYKVFAASSALDDANARYSEKSTRYASLRQQNPYPNRENLAVFEQQKQEAAKVISDFQAQLAKKEFPLEPITPEQFQNHLTRAVADIRTKASGANIELLPKDKFYLGFETYEGKPPDKDAATPLGRDLKAIEWVTNQLLTAPILKLSGIKREDIPEEKPRGASTSAPKPAAGPANKGANSKKPEFVSTHVVNFVFTCRQRQAANILNALISPSAPQFLIPRNVRITNSNPKPPSRVDPNAAAAAPADPAAPAPEGGKTLTYLVGEETVEVSLQIEIVDFAEPAANTAAK